MWMRGGTVVTLNYDNCLERAALAGVGLQVDTGPSPRGDYAYPGWDRSKAIRIIKLHGALNWATDPSTGLVRELNSDEIYTNRMVGQISNFRPTIPAIIFGAGNKLRPDGPYLDLYVEFKRAVAAARRLIVIGYGSVDAHVNEVIRRWIGQVGDGRLLRVSTMNQTGAVLPRDQQVWVEQNPRLQVQVIAGRARDTIAQLMRPTPGLQR
jgi:hypothetical protein